MKRHLRIVLAALIAAPLLAQEKPIELQGLPTRHPASMAISPKGDMIVSSVTSDGNDQLWLQSLSTGTGRALTTTDGTPSLPCWSPDGKSVAYFEHDKLKRIDLDSDSPKTLVNTNRGVGEGCAWNKDGTILFSMGGSRDILRVPEDGGPFQAATPPDAQYYQSPHLLPDGRHFLFYSAGSGIRIGDLQGSPPQVLLAADSGAVYARSGHLLFVRGQTLYAQAFDPAELKLSGNPIQIAQGIPLTQSLAALSTSASGALTYRTGGTNSLRRYQWFDRAGKTVGKSMDVASVGDSAPMLSPDGKTVVLVRTLNGNIDLWLLTLDTGDLSRLTTDPAFDMWPAWAPDGNTVYFGSTRSGRWEMYERPVTENGTERLVLRNAATRLPRDVSPDGKFVIYDRYSSPTVQNNIGVVQVDGNPPSDISIVSGMGTLPQFSPDGRWIAYQASSAERVEIFVQPFPSGRPTLVSKSGGSEVRWNPNGKELFYIDPDKKLMAVPIELDTDSQEARAGVPVGLFTSPGVQSAYGQQYMVDKTGQRFLIATVPAERVSIQVFPNWQPN